MGKRKHSVGAGAASDGMGGGGQKKKRKGAAGKRKEEEKKKNSTVLLCPDHEEAERENYRRNGPRGSGPRDFRCA